MNRKENGNSATRRTWFITGAGRGMGIDLARAALEAGHNVAATGRNPDRVREAVGEHEALLTAVLDVTSPKDAEDAVRAAGDRFGGVGVLVSNAGSSPASSRSSLRSRSEARSRPTSAAR